MTTSNPLCSSVKHRLEWQMCVAVLIAGLCLMSDGSGLHAQSGSITVSTTAQSGGGGCTLADAILSANDGTAHGGCAAGATGANRIVLPAGTYSMTTVGFQDRFFCCGGEGPYSTG